MVSQNNSRLPAGVAIRRRLHDAFIGEYRAYKAQGDTDTTEGRGPLRTIGWYLNEQLAKLAAKGQGVFGADGYVSPEIVNVIVYIDPDTGESVVRKLGELLQQQQFEDDDEVRARALAKLSAEERRALGLK